MGIKYTKKFNYRAFKNMPKLEFWNANIPDLHTKNTQGQLVPKMCGF
jgi:hypothetical protein